VRRFDSQFADAAPLARRFVFREPDAGPVRSCADDHTLRRTIMGFGRGALLWLLGIPLPIILLLALFWHN
jgi:hypothetical protein